MSPAQISVSRDALESYYMPPEASSWERRDCFREKRYDRLDKENIARSRRDFLSSEGAVSLAPLQPVVSAISSNHSSQVQWPHAPSRQGRDRLSFEDDGHGLQPTHSTDFPAQDKMYEDENLGFCLERRYTKCSREFMGRSLGRRYLQGDQSSQHCDNGDTSLFSTGRFDFPNGKVADQMPSHPSHPHSDLESSWDNVQLEQCRKTVLEHSSRDHKFGMYKRSPKNDFGRFSEKNFEARLDRYGGCSSNDSLVGGAQNLSKDHSLSSMDWKPPKWTRSGNLSSWSSIFGEAGSSKESRGGELHNTRDACGEISPHHSPSRLTSASILVLLDDEIHPRKKQRLGWGQGLAKYEKQKVDGLEDDNNKSDLIQCAISASPKAEEGGPALGTNFEARSPKAPGSSGSGSPATPYSVTCISSPDEHVSFSGAGFNEVGIHEKPHVKVSDESPLLVIGSHSTVAESSLEYEQLDPNQFTPVNSTTIENLHTGDTCLGISDSKRPGAIGKLLPFKNDILQKLERTECDIDKYEKELKSMNSETEVENCHSLRTNYLDANGDCLLEACMEAVDKGLGDGSSNALHRDVQGSSVIHQLNDRFIVPPLDLESTEACLSHVPLEKQSIKCLQVSPEADHMQDVGSQQSEELALGNRSIECQVTRIEDSTAYVQPFRYKTSEELDSDDADVKMDGEALESQLILAEESKFAACTQVNGGVAVQSSCVIDSANPAFSILAANKELAREASEVFEKLLPTSVPGTCGILSSGIIGSSGIAHERYREEMDAKIIDHRHFLNFKERALALKFRALKHLWKEGQFLLPTRKHRARAQRRTEISCRLNGGNQKCRSSIQFGIASPAGNLASVPTEDAFLALRKLLLNVKVRPCRSLLKMPALALDDKEKCFSRFITRNGLVEDPIAFEKERTMINPWTPGEKKIFMETFATFGKNFSKIASFLDHKTTADCVEFYYKNQKSEDIDKLKKRHEFEKQKDCYRTSTYLATSGNSRHRESNAVSLDVMNTSSAVASCTSDQAMRAQGALRRYSGRPTMGVHFDPKRLRNKELLEGTTNESIVDAYSWDSERECTAAADVLAGICGAFSSEAVGSCITSSVDLSEGPHEKICPRPNLKKNAKMDHPLTFEVVRNIETQYSSEESCEELCVDWTDDEKALFINALTMFGKDFGRISCHVHSRTEDQCKAFFSKVRKRLGLDALMHQESIAPTKRKPRNDDDKIGPIEMQLALCNLDSSKKKAESPESSVLNAAQGNVRSDIVADEFCRNCFGNETHKISSDDGNASPKGEIELRRNVEALQNDVELVSCEASLHSEAHQLPSNGSLLNSGGGIHLGELADLQQTIKKQTILDAVSEKELCSSKPMEEANSIEAFDTSRVFSGNNIEVNEHKPCEPVSTSLDKFYMDNVVNVHVLQSDLDMKNMFIDSKADSKKQFQDGGSQNEPVSLEEDKRLPLSMKEDRCPVSSVTSECSRSAGSGSSPPLVPCNNLLSCCSSSNLGTVTYHSILKATLNQRSSDLNVFGDVMSKENCFTGSELTDMGINSSGANSGGDKSVPDPIHDESKSTSSTSKVGWGIYAEGNSLNQNAFPVNGQEKMPMCASSAAQFQQQLSDVFSQIPRQMVHYMHIAALVLSKNQSMFQQVNSSSALVGNQQLENPMLSHHRKQGGSHQIQQGSQLGRMIQPIQHRGFSDSEQPSHLFGRHQFQVLNQRNVHCHRSVDSSQEMHQQTACNSEQSSRLPVGPQLFCRKTNVDTYQQPTLQQLAQGCNHSHVKSQRQHHIIQQKSQQQSIPRLQKENKHHQNVGSQFLQKSTSEHAMESSKQRKQSLQFPEQYQLLHQWQQKHKAHNSIRENHMFQQKSVWQMEQQEHLLYKQSDNKFGSSIKPVSSCQQQASHLQSPCLEMKAKACSESEAQGPKTGDVKLFGQILLSHTTNLSKSPPNQVQLEASSSIASSLQGNSKNFNPWETDECRVATSTVLSEHRSSPIHPSPNPEGAKASAKETDSCSVQKAIALVTERLAREALESKQNIPKFSTCYSGQEFCGQNSGFWEGNRVHDSCKTSVPVQSGSSSLSRDVKYLQSQSIRNFSPDMCVNQAATIGKCKERTLKSNVISGVQSRIMREGVHPVGDAPAVKDTGFHLSESREQRNDPYLYLKRPDNYIELQKKDVASSPDSACIASSYGRHDTVQPMFGFQPQIRTIPGDIGFQMGGLMSGDIVLDPVTALRMQCSAAEHFNVTLEHPQVASNRDPESGRCDYSR
eukprot:Gb_00676 [translate_table: standard]